jgi:hypothetical protein
MIMIIEDIDLKITRGMVTVEELQDVLNGDVVNNSTAKYVQELIQSGVIGKDQVSNLISKHIAMQENETARLIQMTGDY